MKKTKITTKALSVLLTVIMLFTTISVGLVIPEADLTASAAEIVEKECLRDLDINDAIKEANKDTSKIVRIKLGMDIDMNGSYDSFEPIKGNVIFDFNGHHLMMYHFLTESKEEGDNTEYQLPSSNKGSFHRDADGDLFTNGMFIVESTGTMQIINSNKNETSVMQVVTEYENTHRGKWTALANDKDYYQTSSSLIYSEGTLILGDKNSDYNSFDLYSHSVCRNSNTGDASYYGNKAAVANAYTVTINNSKAVFKMYGGKVQACAAAEARRNLYADVYCYALNVNNCYTAEIYGGEINVPDISVMYIEKKTDIGSNGIYSTGDANDGGISRIAAIRNNSSNLYIFDVNCYVESETDKDSSKNNNQYTSCIWAVAAPYIYGGQFEVKTWRGSGNSSAQNHGYIVQGGFRLAQQGVLTPSSNYGGLENYEYYTLDAGGSGSRKVAVWTVFLGNNEGVADTEKARNAINMFDYEDFPKYLKAYTSTSVDAYYGNSVITSNGDATAVATPGSYLRNGYTHTGWQGKTHPGGEYKADATSPSAIELHESGGSLYLAPVWTANEYSITYVLGGTSEFPVINENTLNTNHKIYTIDDKENKIPIPVRHGYTFNGWTVTETDRWPTDDSFGWGSAAGTGEEYETLGKYGNVTLTAKWTANKYNIDVYTDKGNTKYSVNYSAGAVQATTPIRTNIGLTHYNFNGYYEVVRTSANSNWLIGDRIYVAEVDGNGNILREYTKQEIDEQFYGKRGDVVYGKYGDIAELRASFTPVEYDILYFIDSEDNVADTPVLSDPDHFIYNVEDGGKELSPYKPSGEKFNGWEVTWTDGNWTVGEIVKAIPDDGTPRYGNVYFKANCDPRDYVVTVEIADDEIFPTNDREYGYSFKNGLTISEIPSKPGYDFNGWIVKEAAKVNDDDVVNWPVGEYAGTFSGGSVRFAGGYVGNVTLKADWVPTKYNITFNGNNAKQGDELGVKEYHIGSTADVPYVSRDGYIFKGWKPEKTSGTWIETQAYFIDSETVLDGFWGDVTLVAQWEQQPYDVSFNLDGGIGNDTTLTYKTESSLTLPVDPVRTGYIFEGWEIEACDGSWAEYKAELEAEGKLVSVSIPSGYYGDITLKAKWTAIEYTIQLKVNSTVVESIRYHINESVILPEKTAPGQEFVTWKLSESKDGWNSGYYAANVEIPAGKYGNIVLEAELNAKTYYLSFVEAVKGSDELVPVPGLAAKQYYFTKEFELPELRKDGYTFVGWEVVSEFDESSEYGGWRNGDIFNVELGSGKTTIAANRYYGDVTLKAVYTIADNNKYNISFNTNEGNPIADIEYDIESDKTLPEPEKTGYKFNGWIVLTQDGNWTKGIYPAGEPLEGKYGNVSLLADWSPLKYTITWIIDGKKETSEFEYKTTPFYNGTPEKASTDQYTYTFIGWSPAIEPVTGEATYEAQFKATLRSYDVTWKYKTDVSDADYTTETVTYKYGEHPIFNNGQNPTITFPVGEYWNFKGWQIEGTASFIDDSTTVTGAVTYVAVFEKIENPVTITWVVDGAEYVTYWEKNAQPSYPGSNVLPDKNGYSRRISGWKDYSTDGELTEIPLATVDAVYSANIGETPKNYEAVFDLNGGKYDGTTTVKYDCFKGLTMPQPEKAGYIFSGWIATEADSEKWSVNTVYTDEIYENKWGEVSFKAHWTVATYTVTVKTDSGTTEFTYNIEDEDKTFPEIEKEGYELTGWIIENASAGSNWMMGDTIAVDKPLKGMYGDITVSPVWTAKTYKINWVSGDSTQTVDVRYGEHIVTYAPVAKDGYTAKWDKEIPAVMPAHDLTFNADYSPIQYYLKLNANGGTLTDGKPVESFYYDIESKAVLPVLEREGADFAGWRVSAGSGSWTNGNVIEAGTALAGNYGNVTLTAVWTFHIYEITWVVGDTERVTRWYYGAEPSYDGTPYKPSDDNWSYKFSGKWTDENGENTYDGNAIPTVTGNAKYIAVFDRTLREYVIKWDVNGYVISQTYFFGETVKCPYTESNPPSRPSTEEYDFTFLGWSPEVSTTVTGDITYTAVFDVYTKIQGLRTDKTAVFIDINDSVNITAIISPSTATSKDVEWVSLNQNIATVNEDGKVIGVSAGETLVRVQSKDGKFRAYCFVNVAPVITDYIVVSAAGISTTRLPGEAVQLYATVMPENASNKIVKWTTSDPAVATVDANGLVLFGSKAGSAVITAISDGYASGSITVTTTTDQSVINDNVKTYVVMFNKSSSAYIIAGQTYESINIICKEGDTIEFLLAEPHFVTLNATQFERDTDGVYRIKDIDSNYTVFASERPDMGFEEEPEEPGDNGTVKLSFFDKLKAFFRSIVEFFRGLFGG